MKFYHINAFTDSPDGGNPAGIVICRGGCFPSDEAMQQLAADIGFSETAFICNERGHLHLRYFTPECEVDLCGHATIAAGKALLASGLADPGEDYRIETRAGEINIKLERRFISMAMPPARVIATVKDQQSLQLVHQSLGLEYKPVTFMVTCGNFTVMNPMVVTAGLPFLIVPVHSREMLDAIQPNLPLIREIAKGLNCAGIYAFAFEPKEVGTMAHCRGFYPLLGIDEECATGTAVAALSHYLNGFGQFPDGREARFIQGEAMGRPSVLSAYIRGKGASQEILIGGNAIVLEVKDVEV